MHSGKVAIRANFALATKSNAYLVASKMMTLESKMQKSSFFNNYGIAKCKETSELN